MVLKIGEHLEGLNRELCWSATNGVEWDEARWFPVPGRIDGPAPRDITFELIRGDFQVSVQVWITFWVES